MQEGRPEGGVRAPDSPPRPGLAPETPQPQTEPVTQAMRVRATLPARARGSSWTGIPRIISSSHPHPRPRSSTAICTPEVRRSAGHPRSSCVPSPPHSGRIKLARHHRRRPSVLARGVRHRKRGARNICAHRPRALVSPRPCARPAPLPPPAAHTRTAPPPPAALLAHGASVCASGNSAHTHRTPAAIPPPPPAPWRSPFAGGRWAVTCASVRRRAAPLGNGTSGARAGTPRASPVRACAALPPQARPAPRRPGVCVRLASHRSPVPSARAAWHTNSATGMDTDSAGGALRIRQHRRCGHRRARQRRKREMREVWMRRSPRAEGGDGVARRRRGRTKGGRTRAEGREEATRGNDSGRGAAGRDGQLDSQRTARPGEDDPGAQRCKCRRARRPADGAPTSAQGMGVDVVEAHGRRTATSGRGQRHARRGARVSSVISCFPVLVTRSAVAKDGVRWGEGWGGREPVEETLACVRRCAKRGQEREDSGGGRERGEESENEQSKDTHYFANTCPGPIPTFSVHVIRRPMEILRAKGPRRAGCHLSWPHGRTCCDETPGERSQASA
ncbi:hypothetical protein FB451DRAFT_1434774 [Mycena latifolia]|nr:hypothetical protein FB451DRAFT_1434774 [Mycena latifolia]